jgi:hypothetical protein
MSKISVPIVQWYINHTCNLACDHCLSFNNYRVSGNYPWADSAASVAAWSGIIDIEDLTIIGGEPLLHPEIDLWVCGVRDSFPTVVDFKVCTNGTRLGHVDPAMLRGWRDRGVVLEVHCHSESDWNRVWPVLHSVFPGLETETFVDRPALHAEETRVYCGGLLVALVRKSWNFLPTMVRSTAGGLLEFHHSDPVQSHRSCEIRQCHYIVEGRMYKCGPIAAGATVKNLPMEPRATALYSGYRPVLHSDTNLAVRLAELAQPTAACALCPIFGSVDRPEDLFELRLKGSKPRVG